MNDVIWQETAVVEHYLSGVRGAIPLAEMQLAVMLRLIRAARDKKGETATSAGSVQAVLDLGCGDGILAHAVLDQYPEAEAVLIDFSQPMLEAARARLAGRNVSLLALDYGELGWQEKLPQRQFDVIVSGYSIHHQPDARKKSLYVELFELLSPGGIFLNMEHVASPTAWIEAQHDALFLEALLAFQKNNPKPKTSDELAEGYHQRAVKEANILTAVETQCAWLREIGYTQVDVFLKIFELALFGGIREPDAEASGN